MTTFQAKDAKAALAIIGRVIERRNTIPILGNVMIKASGEKMTISGTDLDIYASAEIDCTDTEPFAITISAKTFTAFIRGSIGAVSLTATAETATLENDGMEMTVNLFCPASDMPVMGFEPKSSVEMTESMLHKALSSVAFAMSSEETRYYLNGVYMHSVDGNLRAVATDGRRMAIYDIGVAWTLDPAILPRKTALLLISAMKPGGNHSVLIEQDGMKMRFTHPEWTITSKMIDGEYPNYARTIQAPSDKFSCTISHAQISRIPDMGLCAIMDPENGKLTCKELGEVSVSVPLQGHGPRVGFNIQYLKDFTRNHGVINISSAGPGNPAMIKAEDSAFIGVLMPMRIM